jgi:hypothetical protein
MRIKFPDVSRQRIVGDELQVEDEVKTATLNSVFFISCFINFASAIYTC